MGWSLTEEFAEAVLHSAEGFLRERYEASGNLEANATFPGTADLPIPGGVPEVLGPPPAGEEAVSSFGVSIAGQPLKSYAPDPTCGPHGWPACARWSLAKHNQASAWHSCNFNRFSLGEKQSGVPFLTPRKNQALFLFLKQLEICPI